MQTIFSFGLSIGRHAMGSSEALGTPSGNDPDTQESDNIHDGSENGGENAPKPPEKPERERNRKRGSLVDDEEVLIFTSMTEAVREVASAIRDSTSVGVHPGLYNAAMDAPGFSDESKMVAFSHLLDNKAQGLGFVTMVEDHHKLWLMTFLSKHYYV